MQPLPSAARSVILIPCIAQSYWCPCSCSHPAAATAGVRRIIDDCLAIEWSCGGASLAIGADGCVEALIYEHPERKLFAACFRERLASARFPCAPSQRLDTWVDSCTIK